MTPERRNWHLEKSVSIGHIITTLSVAATVLWWAATTEGRLEKGELISQNIIKSMELINSRLDADRAENELRRNDIKREIDARLSRIETHAIRSEDKIDKIITIMYENK